LQQIFAESPSRERSEFTWKTKWCLASELQVKSTSTSQEAVKTKLLGLEATPGEDGCKEEAFLVIKSNS